MGVLEFGSKRYAAIGKRLNFMEGRAEAQISLTTTPG
jgi:hypothetical protein